MTAVGGVTESKWRIGVVGQFIPDRGHHPGGEAVLGSANRLEHELPGKLMSRFQQFDGRQFAHVWVQILESKEILGKSLFQHNARRYARLVSLRSKRKQTANLERE